MAKRRYTDEEKAAAVELLRDASKTFYEVRDATGVPVGTLHAWATAAGLERSDATTRAATDRRRLRLQAKREALAETFLDRAAELEDRMDEPHIDFRGKDSERVEFPRATSGDVRNYAVAIAVLIDKFRLEMGEHTEHTRTDDLGVAEAARQKVDDLAERRTQKSA